MQPAAAATPARWRCVGDASLAGHGQQRLAGVVRLVVARRAASGAVRASSSSSRLLGPVRALVSEERGEDAAAGERAAAGGEEEEEGAVRLFVGPPVVSDGRGVSCPRAVSAALRALKLLGVDDVELPVS